MASPPPPYSNITGVARAVMKFNSQEPFASYDGNARPGELVVDTTNYSLYIGNAEGGLNAVGNGGGNGGYGNSNVASFLSNYGSNTIVTTGNITAGNVLTDTLFSVDDVFIDAGNGLVEIRATSNVVIKSNSASHEWIFDNAGTLRLPGGNGLINSTANTILIYSDQLQTTGMYFDNAELDIYGAGNVSIFADNANSALTWTFDTTGNLTLPASGVIKGPTGISPAPTLLDFGLVSTGNANVAQLLTVGGNANINTLNLGASAYMPNIVEFTTGTSPLLLWDDGGNGRVGYDSTVYYDHTEEQLHVGNVVINDNVTGGTIGLNESDQDLQFTVNSGGTTTEVMRLIGATALLKLFPSSGTPPTSSLGAFYFNNDSGQLSGVGLYFCANTSLGNGGWQLVNLT